MSEPTSPSEIARETLRLLVSRRMAPTPENYRRFYLEITGQPVGDALPDAERKVQDPHAPVWARLILDLLKQWEARHTGLTTARKRESLEKLLSVPGSDAGGLAHKLRNLLTSWSTASLASPDDVGLPNESVTAALGPTGAVEARRSAVPGVGTGMESESALGQIRELLAQTLEFAVSSQLGHAPELAEEAGRLASAARAASGREELVKLTAALRQFWFKVELRGGDNAELHQGLLRLLRLLIDNTHELLGDDQWLRGQVAVLQQIVTSPLDLGTLAEAERRLKDVVLKQGLLKTSLIDAKAALKQMITSFIDRLGVLSESTGDYHTRLEGYAQKIRQTDDIRLLNDVLTDLLEDTRSAQLDVTRTHDELLAARHQVQAAEEKVEKLQRELEQVSELMQEDPLTGVLNRRGLDEACQREISRAARSAAPFCVSLLDIDNFKRLNDTLGHQAGDEALQHLVRVTKRNMRPSDVLARYGGEEFLLLLPQTQQEEAVEVMVRLQRNLTQAFFLHNNERVLITFSAGVAQRRENEPQSELIARADTAMYEAKHSGKNRVCAA